MALAVGPVLGGHVGDARRRPHSSRTAAVIKTVTTIEAMNSIASAGPSAQFDTAPNRFATRTPTMFPLAPPGTVAMM